MTKFNEAQLAYLEKLIRFKGDFPEEGFDVRGNIWGDVWGDVLGDVEGDVEGNVGGSVLGTVGNRRERTGR